MLKPVANVAAMAPYALPDISAADGQTAIARIPTTFPYVPGLLSFRGTETKSEWWLVTIISSFIGTFAFVGFLLSLFNASSPLREIALAGISIVFLLSIWASLAVSARRFRDLKLSPWLTLLYFIPYVGWLLVWIPCGFLPFSSGKRTKVRRRTVSKSSS